MHRPGHSFKPVRRLSAGAALVPLLALSACSGPYSSPKVTAKESPPETLVSVHRVVTTPLPEVITANGELFAEEAATVSAKVPGRVAKLYVDLGSMVKAGGVLAELEKDDYEFRVRQAEAMVEQTRARLGIQGRSGDEVNVDETAIVREAEAAYKESQLVLATTAQLHNEGVVSRIDFEKAQVRAQGLKARHEAAREEVMQLRSQLIERRAQLALARQQLSDSTIRAPFSGAVTRRHASLGEYLGINAAVVTLVRQHPLRVRLEVPERQAARVRQGQLVEVRLEGSPLARTGHVARISPAIEAQSRSLLVEGEIPNQDAVLRPGSFVQATITVDPRAAGIVVPRGALVSFAGIDRMFVVRDGLLEDRIVRTGRLLDGGGIEILEGLKPGDLLVSNASDRMARGWKVKVR